MDIVPLKSHKLGLLIATLVFLDFAWSGSLVAAASDGDLATPGAVTPTPSPADPAVTKSKTQDNFYFDPAPFDQSVVDGDEVLLRCDVSNRHLIRFYWTLDGRQVKNNSRRFQEDSDLRILRVDRELDAGSFRCIATNDSTGISVTSTSASLDIHWLQAVAGVELKQPRSDAEVVTGVDVTLRCQADGNPEPNVEWFKNKVRLVAEGEKVTFHKNNRIRIGSLTAADNGVYSCRATNAAGDVSSSVNYVINVDGPNTPRLNGDTFNSVLLVREGSRALLHCQYTNTQATEWNYSGRRLQTSSADKRRVFPNGTLLLEEVRPENVGSYSCSGISQSGVRQTFVTELLLAYINRLTEDSFEPKSPPNGLPVVVPVNGRYEVHCLTPKGLPLPVQRWESPSGSVLPTDGRVKVEEGSLTITGAGSADTGNYSCVASNTAGDVTRSVWIVVSVPPTIIQNPLSTRRQEGGRAVFHCRVRATPYPVTVINWRKEDEPIDMGHHRFIVDQEAGDLTIEDVHLADKGNYACVVNTTGHPVEISTNAHLYVEKMLKFKPKPVNSKLELGSDSKIYCMADGRVSPTVRWLKAGSADFPAHVRDDSGTLMFTNVLYIDAGMYTCIATSEQGTINATIQIDVVVKPKFKVRPQNTTAYEGHPTMINCVAVGNPQPTIHWDKNNQVNGFDAGRFKMLSNGSLYVTKVNMEDTGRYGCTAGNSGGFQREEVFLLVGTYGVDGPSFPNKFPGLPGYNGKYPFGGTPPSEEEDDKSFNMMKTIIIAVCSAVAYLAVVIGLTVYCSIRLVRAKNLRKQQQGDSTAEDKVENGAIPTERTELMEKKERDSSIIKAEMDARSHVSGVSSHPSNSSQPSSQSSRRGYDKLNFPRHDLQTLGMLGKGHYGDVFLAKAHGIRDGEPETLVVVKSLLTREEGHHFEFRREMEMFSKINHENIVKLLGVCREMEPQFLITEYCEWGDLKQFLWATRKDNGKRNVKLPPLTIAQRVTMCSQIAMGMEHLANNRFIHKDLASRNILLSSTLDLKISNLGLCRDVYTSEYYPFHQQLQPLRWMPPEAVLDDDFSTKSDVWSFGVTIWEIFTSGDLPYQLKNDEEVLRCLKTNGGELGPAPECPPQLAAIISQCMSSSPKERPSFSELVLAIGDLTVDSDV